jgi:hypothetical protein
MPHPCDQIVKDARSLESAGMTNRQLSQLHHFALSGRMTSFAAVAAYFSVRKELRSANAASGRRLRFVTSEHARTGRSFEKLIAEAMRTISLDRGRHCR